MELVYTNPKLTAKESQVIVRRKSYEKARRCFLVNGIVPILPPPAFSAPILIETPAFYWDDPQVTILSDDLRAQFVETPDFTPVVLSSDQPWGAAM
ncbi:hypothetical protein PITCH_A1040009 [uncultured Desulfobacterium sp.]|uniref:Uncharacterized protein n=1 Tax=uncultured Desulfobacterium sp. TaxID=201089 RepID=A0A445MQQ3_9BACT|nr:hypothetical protein PITCH_A1040009 [uncultured Desulfobacterium sp.]